MKYREYIEAMIKVLSFAKENNKLSNKDGERLAGELWQNIKVDLFHLDSSSGMCNRDYKFNLAHRLFISSMMSQVLS